MEVDKMVPEVYYKESRDFSYVGRLFEILVNYLKTGGELVRKGLKDVNSESLIDLLCTTLGFETKHKYINTDLISICNSFVSILRKKGSLEAIEESVKILLNSQHLQDYSVTCISVDPDSELENPYVYEVNIGLPKETQDIILLEDLFDYILPTGWLYRFYKIETEENTYKVNLEYGESIDTHNMETNQLAQVSKPNYNTDDNDYNNRSQTYTGVVFNPDNQNNE